MKRTEEQKVSQAGIVVKLGSAEYSVAPLVIRDAREWRKKVVGLLSGLSSQDLEVTTDEPDTFDHVLKYLLVTMQDTVIDLFFEYAQDLDRDEIEGIATEEQIEEAFSRVIEVAFPLAQSPAMLKTRLLQ